MSWMDDAAERAYITEWARPGRLKAMLDWYRASPLVLGKPGEVMAEAPVYPPEHFRVTMPHLLIWGMGDTALMPEAIEGLEAYCDDLTVERVEGADHWLHHQKPREVARIMRDWLTAAD